MLCGLGGAGPAAGLVLEDEGIEEGLGGLLLVAIEAGEGFELKAALFLGSALVLFEDEAVGGDPERVGELANALKHGLGGAGLVAVNLDKREVYQLGQGALGKAARRSSSPRGCPPK